LNILEKAFVVFRLTPFSRKLRSEIGKKNKIYFYDLGIRNALINSFSNLDQRDDIGALFENFCIMERIKRIQYEKWYRSLYFWRNIRGKEIDLIEEYNGFIYGYEFKWGIGDYKIPREFLDKYSNSSVVLVNRSNLNEFLGF
jgi:predicted AAA+ superfamily ATPase